LNREIGKRGLSNDADVFRSGDPSDLKKLITDTAKAVQAKIDSLTFTAEDAENGGIKARLDVMAKSIVDIKTAITKNEPQDYHWELIATLVHIIAALFDYIDERQT
jgi:hypothetical protein